MLLRSIKFGIVLFVLMSLINKVLKAFSDWKGLLFGTIIATIIYYAFQRIEKKEERMEM